MTCSSGSRCRSIHARSPDPREFPAIEPNYFTHAADRATALAMLRLIRRVAASPALAPHIVRETRPGADVQDEGALLEYARGSGQTAWHTVGTCRMGPPSDSVVDARLRVHGVQRLRVIDASVMPTITSGNTAAPTMMIAEKGAAMITEDWRG